MFLVAPKQQQKNNSKIKVARLSIGRVSHLFWDAIARTRLYFPNSAAVKLGLSILTLH